MRLKLLILLWCVLWVRIAVPWRNFQWTPSFRRLELIPFSVGSTRGQILNLLAFVPLGFILARLGWSTRAVTFAALGVSALTECLQLFSSRRYPSITDLILNTAGAVVGMAIVTVLSRKGPVRHAGPHQRHPCGRT